MNTARSLPTFKTATITKMDSLFQFTFFPELSFSFSSLPDFIWVGVLNTPFLRGPFSLIKASISYRKKRKDRHMAACLQSVCGGIVVVVGGLNLESFFHFSKYISTQQSTLHSYSETLQPLILIRLSISGNLCFFIKRVCFKAFVESPCRLPFILH